MVQSASREPLNEPSRPTNVRSKIIPASRGATRTAIALLAAAALGWLTPRAYAPPVPGAIGFDPTGVYVDPNGVLKTRRLDDTGKLGRMLRDLAGRRPDPTFRYVSLPKLFAQVQQKVEAGEAIPDDMRYLGGMTKLRFVFVYPGQKDLVIAGDTEPYDATLADRPIGLHTGRPVLQLDDLVTAFRTCGPARAGGAFGCKIQMTQQGANAIVSELNRQKLTVQTQPGLRRQVADAMARAAGPQRVVFLGVRPDTRLALTCVEADLLLKRLVIGLDRSPVPAVPSYLSTQTSPDVLSNRFWFEAMYEPIVVSAEGNAYELRGQSLQVNSRQQFVRGVNQGYPPAERYAAHVTKYFSQLARFIPAFADLANLADLGLLAALVAHDKLDERAGWDISWVIDPKGYPVAETPVPKTVETLVNYHVQNRVVLYIGGGVQLQYGNELRRRQADEKGELADVRRRPGDDTWTLPPLVPTPAGSTR